MGARAVEAMDSLRVCHEHRIGTADEKAALDHPDDAADSFLEPRRVGDGTGEAAVEDAVAAIGDKQLARRRQARPDLGGEHLKGRSRDFHAERNDLDRHRRVRPSRSTSLAPSTMMASCRLALATIFSRSKAPPSPLIRFKVPRSTSSAPSIVRSICRCSANYDSGRPAALACAAVRSEVGMPMKRKPWRYRRARASIAKAAVEPMPSPTTMSSWTSSTAASAAARISASRSASVGNAADSWLGRARGGAGADRGYGRRVVRRAEDRRAGDDGGGACCGRLSGSRVILAAIDFDDRNEAALRAHSHEYARSWTASRARMPVRQIPG